MSVTLRNRIEEELSVHIPPGKSSGRVKVKCPFCQHERHKHKRDQPLSIDLDDGYWRCHHCERKGQVFEDSKPIPKPEETHLDIDPKILKYLTEERCISEEAIRDLKIGSSVEFMNGKNVRCINFNYFLRNRHVNTKLRTADKQWRTKIKGGLLPPYNIDVLSQAKELGYILITEGELDAASFYTAGIHAVISPPSGANANLGWLDGYIEDILKLDAVYISVDDDEKGRILEKALVDRIGEDKCRIIRLPYNDANRTLQELGPEALAEGFENAELPEIEGVYKIESFQDEAERVFLQGWPETYPIFEDDTVWAHEKYIDDRGRCLISRMGLLEMPLGQLIELSGTPSSGKTQLADFFTVQMINLYGWRAAKFSAEEDKEENLNNMISKISQRPYVTLDLEEYRLYRDYLNKKLYYMEGVDAENILSKMEYCVRAYGVKLIVLDNWSFIDLLIKSGQSEHVQTGYYLGKFQSFTRKFNVTILLVAHPTKLKKKSVGKGYEIPTGYNISGSSHHFNKPDVGISVEVTQPGITEGIIWKVRKQEYVGKPEPFRLHFIKERGGIYETIQQNIRRKSVNPFEESDYEEEEDHSTDEENTLEDIFGVYQAEG